MTESLLKIVSTVVHPDKLFSSGTSEAIFVYNTTQIRLKSLNVAF